MVIDVEILEDEQGSAVVQGRPRGVFLNPNSHGTTSPPKATFSWNQRRMSVAITTPKAKHRHHLPFLWGKEYIHPTIRRSRPQIGITGASQLHGCKPRCATEAIGEIDPASDRNRPTVLIHSITLLLMVHQPFRRARGGYLVGRRRWKSIICSVEREKKDSECIARRVFAPISPHHLVESEFEHH